MQLIEQLGHDLGDAGFNGGVNATVFGLDPATAGQQGFVFDDAPGFFIALAQGFDLF